jgi:hypothetical protein
MGWNTKRWARRLSRPSTWSVGARRLFVAGLPIAIPLWLLAVLVVAAIGIFKSIVRPIAAYWNDPPKRLGSRGYGYSALGCVDKGDSQTG